MSLLKIKGLKKLLSIFLAVNIIVTGTLCLFINSLDKVHATAGAPWDGTVDTTEKNAISVSISKSITSGTITLIANVTGTESTDLITYQWKHNDVDIQGATSDTYQVPFASSDDFISTRSYKVEVKLVRSGTELATETSLPIKIDPVVSIDIKNQATESGSYYLKAICHFDSTFFGNSIPDRSYQWYKENLEEKIEGATSDTYTPDSGSKGKKFFVEMKFTYTLPSSGIIVTVTAYEFYHPVIYVDQKKGNDDYNGLYPTDQEVVVEKKGPVQTLAAAYGKLADSEDVNANTIVICIYNETGYDTSDYYNATCTELTPPIPTWDTTQKQILYNDIFSELAVQDRDISTNPDAWWVKGKATTITSKYNNTQYSAGIRVTNRGADDQHILLTANTKFENIDIKDDGNHNMQWYANGFNLTFGENVNFSSTKVVQGTSNTSVARNASKHKNVHIIGASLGGNEILGGKENTLTILSGNISRIVGGGRNGNTFRNGAPTNATEKDAPTNYNYNVIPSASAMYNSHIIVGGKADVALVCGGQTDRVYHGNSHITVQDNAMIYDLVGGSIGNSRYDDYDNGTSTEGTGIHRNYCNDKTLSPYINDFKGSANITMIGGRVNRVFGGCLGRNIWQCRILGNININILEGRIEKEEMNEKADDPYIFGGGACGQAGFKSPNIQTEPDISCHVSINIDGGIVKGNVYGGSYGYYEYAPNSIKGNAGIIVGTTSVNVSGAASIEGNVYGGGKGYDKYSEKYALAQVQGCSAESTFDTTSVTIGGNATIGNPGEEKYSKVFGGGEGALNTATSLPYDDMAKVIGNTNVTIQESCRIVGYKDPDEIYANEKGGEVFGGGELGRVIGSTNVTVTGGTIDLDVFGGGDQCDVGIKDTSPKNESTITIGADSSTEVNLRDSYGGNKKSGIFYNNSHTQIIDKCTLGYVFGGGWNAQFYGNSTIDINCESVTLGADVLGGCESAKLIGNSYVNLISGTVQNVFGGGFAEDVVPDEPEFEGITNVNITGGTVKGSVYGGADHSVVGKKDGDITSGTNVNIGAAVVPATATDPADIVIEGSVFGGGSKTDQTEDFDPTDPYVVGNTNVKIDATGYDGTNINDTAQPTFTIGGSIFGAGSKCTVEGMETVSIKNYGSSDKVKQNKSIQRAKSVTIESSYIELEGEADSTNIHPTELYSLNHIGTYTVESESGIVEEKGGLILKAGSHLYLRRNCNLLQKYESQGYDGKLVIKSDDPDNLGKFILSADNRIYIHEGFNMTVCKNQSIYTPLYGDVLGMTWLGIYTYENNVIKVKNEITEVEQGIYVMGSYGNTTSVDDDYTGTHGFLSKFDESKYKIGDIIGVRTDKKTFRWWFIGKKVLTKEFTLTASSIDLGNKYQTFPVFPADGSHCKFDTEGNEPTFTSKTEDKFELLSSNAAIKSPNTQFKLEIGTGSVGWTKNNSSVNFEGNTSDGIKNIDELRKTDVYSANDSATMATMTAKLISGTPTKTDENPAAADVKFDIMILNGDSTVGRIKVIIHIVRDTNPIAHISMVDKGKVYDNATVDYLEMDDTPTINITNKSSATVQYDRTYETEETIAKQELSFWYREQDETTGEMQDKQYAIPTDTKIVMVNKSSGTPVYYYYKVIGYLKAIDLTGFTKMGSSTKYSSQDFPTVKSENITENYSFIFDFSDVKLANFEVDHLKIKFDTYNENNETMFNLSEGRVAGFGVKNETPTYSLEFLPDMDVFQKKGDSKTECKIVTKNSIKAIDTTYDGYEMGVKFVLYKKDGDKWAESVFPNNSAFEYNNEFVQPIDNGSRCTIKLSDNLVSTTANLFLNNINQLDESGEYKLEAKLVCSYNFNAKEDVTKDLGAEVDNFYFYIRSDEYAIKPSLEDGGRLIYNTGKTVLNKSNLSFTLDRQRELSPGDFKPYEQDDKKITIEEKGRLTLFEKNSNVDYKLCDLSNLFAVEEEFKKEYDFAIDFEERKSTTVALDLKEKINSKVYRCKFDIIQIYTIKEGEEILSTKENIMTSRILNVIVK